MLAGWPDSEHLAGARMAAGLHLRPAAGPRVSGAAAAVRLWGSRASCRRRRRGSPPGRRSGWACCTARAGGGRRRPRAHQLSRGRPRSHACTVSGDIHPRNAQGEPFYACIFLCIIKSNRKMVRHKFISMLASVFCLPGSRPHCDASPAAKFPGLQTAAQASCFPSIGSRLLLIWHV